MSSAHSVEPCQWQCPWKGTGMCVQRLLCGQALAEHRVSLGVLCGLKHLYRQHGLPPCVMGEVIDWSGPQVEEEELAVA